MKASTDLERLRTLSLREFEVMTRVVDGEPHKAIADDLGASMGTVCGDVKTVYRKTGTDCIANLTKFAIRVGITSLHEY